MYSVHDIPIITLYYIHVYVHMYTNVCRRANIHNMTCNTCSII